MSPHLCHLATDWRGDVPPGGYLVEEKIDGWRALYFRGYDGRPRLWTRNGQRIEGVDHILYRLGQLERGAGQPLFIDGEFQVGGSLEATKRWCERGWKLGGTAGLFHAFDIAPMVEWAKGGWDKPLHERKAWLEKLMRHAEADPSLSWDWAPGSHGAWEDKSAVVLMPDSWVSDAGDVLDEAQRVWARGGEGLMLKNAEAPYRRLRSDAWQKVKMENAHHWMRRAA